MTLGIRSIGVIALAVLAGAVPVYAGELPARTAEGVESRRDCSAHGSGFFSVPGSETCLRISGRVRSEYGFVPSRSRADHSSGLRTGARVQLDARVPTSYGPLRAVIRYDAGSLRN